MKIALISQEYPPETARGGIGSQTFTKANGLTSLGHEVYVITRSVDQNRYEKLIDNIHVISIPGMENDFYDMTEPVHWLTHSMGVAVELESLHKKVKFDIFDFPEWAAEAYVHLLNRRPWNKIPCVIQLHGPLVMFAHTMDWPDINSTFYQVGTHMESTCVQLVDAVYSSSKCSSNWIHKHYHPTSIDIPVIHTGVDIHKYAPLVNNKNEHPTILFAGRIVKNKGVEELIQAACNLVSDFPDLELRIIGGGKTEYIDQIKLLANQRGIKKLLTFTGYQDKDALIEQMSKAHVFAAPSHYEGGPGFVYLEAMSCGLPVIGCSGSGIDEIIQHEINGMLVAPKNVDELTKTLNKLLSDRDFSKQLSKNAREYILREADSQLCIKKLEKFYLKVIASSQDNSD